MNISVVNNENAYVHISWKLKWGLYGHSTDSNLQKNMSQKPKYMSISKQE